MLYEGNSIELTVGPTDVEIRMSAMHYAALTYPMDFKTQGGRAIAIKWYIDIAKEFEHYIRTGE